MGHLILIYPALEGVNTLMNLLFVVQSFGLLFESLCTHYSIVYSLLGRGRPPKIHPNSIDHFMITPESLYNTHVQFMLRPSIQSTIVFNVLLQF